MATNFLGLATFLEYLGAKWHLKNANFTPYTVFMNFFLEKYYLSPSN